MRLGIYIHWPYCRSICHYCHFNRYVVDHVPYASYYEAFQRALSFWKKKIPHHRPVTVFFGGGTPSLMPPDLVKSILHTIQYEWSVSSFEEVTLEMNPHEAHTAPSFRDAGVTRISMGVQSFHNETLSLLGRTHTVDTIQNALSILKNSAIPYSFDMIYGHKNHADMALWEKELEMMDTWIGEHLSLYHLSYEKGTPFYAYRHHSLPDDDVLKLEERMCAFLKKKGLQRYEISNFAIPGKESKHNLIYWEYDDYLGVGPGAHGRVTLEGKKYATQDMPLPDAWLDACATQGHGMAKMYALPEEDVWCEAVLMGLRLKKGLHMKKLPFVSHITPFLKEKTTILVQESLAYPLDNEEKIILTSKGQNILNSIIHFLQKPLHQR